MFQAVGRTWRDEHHVEAGIGQRSALAREDPAVGADVVDGRKMGHPVASGTFGRHAATVDLLPEPS